MCNDIQCFGVHYKSHSVVWEWNTPAEIGLRRPLRGARVTTPLGNLVMWRPTSFDVVVLTRAVPGRGTIWMLQLFIDDEEG